MCREDGERDRGYEQQREQEGGDRGDYVDGFVVPVPDGKTDAYRTLAAKMAKVFREHGATRVVEALSNDVRRNRCLTDPYEPGSTIKPFIAGPALVGCGSVRAVARPGPAERPVPGEHRLQVLAEPGGALAGQRFGEVFAAGERVERREQRGLGVSDGLGHSRDPHSTLSERLEPEPQGLHLYLEVHHLGSEVLW